MPSEHLCAMVLTRHKRITAEFVGTFLINCTISIAVTENPVQAPFAIGFMVMAIVFSFGYCSGAHFNPAVTLGVVLIGGMPRRKALTYVGVQFAGAILGAFYAVMVHGQTGSKLAAPLPSDESAVGMMRAIAAEVFFTFAVVTVVLQVACSRQKDNNFYGFAIGMAVLAGFMSVGSVSGGAFNPAVSASLQLVKCVVASKCAAFSYIWLYWISHLIGALLSAGCFLLINPEVGIKQLTGDWADDLIALPSMSNETIRRVSESRRMSQMTGNNSASGARSSVEMTGTSLPHMNLAERSSTSGDSSSPVPSSLDKLL